jgi:hypothetical protein
MLQQPELPDEDMPRFGTGDAVYADRGGYRGAALAVGIDTFRSTVVKATPVSLHVLVTARDCPRLVHVRRADLSCGAFAADPA